MRKLINLVENAQRSGPITITAYHGTHSKFDDFDTEASAEFSAIQRLGVWFTDSFEVAKKFALDGDHADYFGHEEAWVVEVKLTFRKALFVDSWESLHDVAGAMLEPYKHDQYEGAFDAFKKRLIDDGYDGIVIQNSTTDSAGHRADLIAIDPKTISVVKHTKIEEPHQYAIQEDTGSEVYFHVTPTKNVESIMVKGLIPQSGDRSVQMGDHGIYLFPSMDEAEHAVMNWLGDEFEEDEPLTMLRVTLPSGANVTREAFEVVCHDPIPPNHIEVAANLDESENYPIKGGEVEVRVRALRGGRYAFSALVGGQEAAMGEFQANPYGDTGSVEEIVVFREFRRKGIATAIYNHFEKMGFRVVPSDDVKPDGRAFWDKRGWV